VNADNVNFSEGADAEVAWELDILDTPSINAKDNLPLHDAAGPGDAGDSESPAGPRMFHQYKNQKGGEGGRINVLRRSILRSAQNSVDGTEAGMMNQRPHRQRFADDDHPPSLAAKAESKNKAANQSAASVFSTDSVTHIPNNNAAPSLHSVNSSAKSGSSAASNMFMYKIMRLFNGLAYYFGILCERLSISQYGLLLLPCLLNLIVGAGALAVLNIAMSQSLSSIMYYKYVFVENAVCRIFSYS
jgi:hypothetical protein